VKKLLLAALLLMSSAANAAPAVKTVVFCGFGGVLFCGSAAEVARQTDGDLYDWTLWRQAAEKIIAERPKVVRWAGFSCGVMAGQLFEAELNKHQIKVQRRFLMDGDAFICPTQAVAKSPDTACFNQQLSLIGGGGGANCETRYYGPFGHILLAFANGTATEVASFLTGNK
jgi:hypothetical protein